MNNFSWKGLVSLRTINFKLNLWKSLIVTSGWGGIQKRTSKRNFKLRGPKSWTRTSPWRNFDFSTRNNIVKNFWHPKRSSGLNFVFLIFDLLNFKINVEWYFKIHFWDPDFEAMNHPLRHPAVDNPLLIYSVQRQNFLAAYFSGKQHVKGTLINQLGMEHHSVRFRLWLQELLFPLGSTSRCTDGVWKEWSTGTSGLYSSGRSTVSRSTSTSNFSSWSFLSWCRTSKDIKELHLALCTLDVYSIRLRWNHPVRLDGFAAYFARQVFLITGCRFPTSLVALVLQSTWHFLASRWMRETISLLHIQGYFCSRFSCSQITSFQNFLGLGQEPASGTVPILTTSWRFEKALDSLLWSWALHKFM